ncbi:MAG: sulfite exporter TauE/SafE family protein [Candidatus Njordarchaeales archaeon]
MLEIIIIFLVALLAGFLGSIFGIGGGSILVPLLDLLLPIDIHYIIPASLVCTISTALSSNVVYLKRELTNVRLATILIPMSAIGAFVGAHLMMQLNQNVLRAIFGAFLIFSAYNILRKIRKGKKSSKNPIKAYGRISRFFSDSYYDETEGGEVKYAPSNVVIGALLTFFGGLLSALLGVGGGIVNMPILLLVLGLPSKAASALSLFLISLNGAVGGTLYLLKGFVDPLIVAPAVIGIVFGVKIGTSVVIKVKDVTLKTLIALFFIVMGLRMIITATGALL